LAKKILGFDSIPLSEACRSISKALMINKIFKNDAYLNYAQQALDIASYYYLQKNETKIIIYQLNLASALQWKSLSDHGSAKATFLLFKQAISLCLDAHSIARSSYNELNIIFARINRLMGSLLFFMAQLVA
jgi:hypothetical protein